MYVEIAWKQNILVTDSDLLKLLLIVFGFGSQPFVCGFSRQNINSVHEYNYETCLHQKYFWYSFYQLAGKNFSNGMI